MLHWSLGEKISALCRCCKYYILRVMYLEFALITSMDASKMSLSADFEH